MIHASIRMIMPTQKHSEVLALLISFSQKTRDEPGCVSCLVYRGTEEEGGILLEEFWSDEAFLELHLRSAQFQKVLQLSELSNAPPEFRFDTILHSSGVETIVKARNQSAA
jgi:quinol monooxygenase YgiN